MLLKISHNRSLIKLNKIIDITELQNIINRKPILNMIFMFIFEDLLLASYSWDSLGQSINWFITFGHFLFWCLHV